MIIMMNLLIAIISDSFAKVNSNSEQASYKEMAVLIHENYIYIPEDRQVEYCDPTKYLIIATDKQQEMDQQVSFEDQVEVVVEQIADRNRDAQNSIIEKLAEMNAATEGTINVKQGEINK